MMPQPEKQHKQHKVYFNFESSIASKLPEPVFDLISELVCIFLIEICTIRGDLEKKNIQLNPPITTIYMAITNIYNFPFLYECVYVRYMYIYIYSPIRFG